VNILQTSIEEAAATLRSLSALEPALTRAAETVRRCLLDGHKLLVCGNGGSAADGADFSTEFTCRFKEDRRPFPAMNLSNGGSLVTAIGNDYDFAEVFARQVRAFGQDGDVLVVFSTSGRSPNIVRALEEASANGLQSIAFLGRGGGAAAGMATVELLVPNTSAARTQESHKFMLHVICEMVDGDLARG